MSENFNNVQKREVRTHPKQVYSAQINRSVARIELILLAALNLEEQLQKNPDLKARLDGDSVIEEYLAADSQLGALVNIPRQKKARHTGHNNAYDQRFSKLEDAISMIAESMQRSAPVPVINSAGAGPSRVGVQPIAPRAPTAALPTRQTPPGPRPSAPAPTPLLTRTVISTADSQSKKKVESKKTNQNPTYTNVLKNSEMSDK